MAQSYSADFSGWQELKLEDLLVAYRKAKADCFFENGFPTAAKFADFESDLVANLKAFLAELQGNSGFRGDNQELLGSYRLTPKKLGLVDKVYSSDQANSGKVIKNGHAHFSDPKRSFEHLCSSKTLQPEFRIIGDFPVKTHILSALWINMIGHKFDASLDDRAYGSRLKRIRPENSLNKSEPKKFHLTAVGSFEPYFHPYQSWRNDGLNAIRSELAQQRQVITVSLDLKSYYHLIDPSFIAESSFQKAIGVKLTDAEQGFTQQLSALLENWALGAQVLSTKFQPTGAEEVKGGLVIGLSASRIIANVLLKKWDDLIREKLSPVHYGRYIDDMFIVIHDPGSKIVHSLDSFMSFLQERLGLGLISQCKNDDAPWEITLGTEYQKGSHIQLQADKQKLFILEGKAGCDLLDSIEKEIHDLSSEHRLMPFPDQLDQSTAAKVLSAAGKVGEEADTLRRADGLTIKRLSWSLQLRLVQTLARDLPKYEWLTERKEFYEFAHNHILRPDQIFAHYQYLPRLLGIAVSLGDWVDAHRIFSASMLAFESLSVSCASDSNTVLINGISCIASDEFWRLPRFSLTCAFIDSVSRNFPLNLIATDHSDSKLPRLAGGFLVDLLDQNLLIGGIDNWDCAPHRPIDTLLLAAKLAKADLSSRPYKQVFADSALADALGEGITQECSTELFTVFAEANLLSVEDIKYFLENRAINTHGEAVTKPKNMKLCEPVIPYMFPTRPYNPQEIAELVPGCITSIKQWARYVRALRGSWVNPKLFEVVSTAVDKECEADVTQALMPILIGKEFRKSVLVGITSLKTDQESWEHSACNNPNLTRERYGKIAELVNQAIKLSPRPKYLIFPELSIPLEWVTSIANRLSAAGICMIAGTEYRHGNNNEIYSEACLVLDEDRLGFRTPIRIWQPKLLPAVGEEKDLTSRFGKKWKSFPKDSQKPVYIHHGFHFGVMVCSELQNSKARVKFQGEVDALMVLAWNKDLDTFASLVEAAALDVHAYTILVNNREYGDSRVRSPAKESFKRELARLRGGENDFCVTVELDLEKLRKFQSRATRWPDENDPFKPVPEGFKLPDNSKRRSLPPK